MKSAMCLASPNRNFKGGAVAAIALAGPTQGLQLDKDKLCECSLALGHIDSNNNELWQEEKETLIYESSVKVNS